MLSLGLPMLLQMLLVRLVAGLAEPLVREVGGAGHWEQVWVLILLQNLG